MSLELRNVNGNCADIYEKDTGSCIMSSWIFSKPPKLEASKDFPTSIVIKLKEAGFESDEIIKMMNELN